MTKSFIAQNLPSVPHWLFGTNSTVFLVNMSAMTFWSYNGSKLIKKLTPNWSQTDQEWIPNGSKMDQKLCFTLFSFLKTYHQDHIGFLERTWNQFHIFSCKHDCHHFYPLHHHRTHWGGFHLHSTSSSRTTDARWVNCFYCMAENQLPLPNF